MFHLDNTSGVPEMPEVKEPQSNTPRWFGESEAQGGISWPGADWFNITQAELLNILHESGIQPDKTKFNQLAEAIRALIKNNVFWATPKDFGAKGNGYTDDTASLKSLFKSKYEHVFIPAGTYVISSKIKCLLDKNLTVVCAEGAVFKLAANARCNMMVFVGNRRNNFNWYGGEFDGNWDNQGEETLNSNGTFKDLSHGFIVSLFNRVKIEHMYVHDFRGHNINHGGNVFFHAKDISLNSHIAKAFPKGGSRGDGITGCSEYVLIEDVYGFTTDDMVAVFAGCLWIEGGTESDSSPVTNLDYLTLKWVTVRNINPWYKLSDLDGVTTVYTWNAVVVAGQGGLGAEKVRIQAVNGYTQYSAVRVGSSNSVGNSPAVDYHTVMGSVSLHDIDVRVQGAADNQNAYNTIRVGAMTQASSYEYTYDSIIKSLSISNVKCWPSGNTRTLFGIGYTTIYTINISNITVNGNVADDTYNMIWFAGDRQIGTVSVDGVTHNPPSTTSDTVAQAQLAIYWTVRFPVPAKIYANRLPIRRNLGDTAYISNMLSSDAAVQPELYSYDIIFRHSSNFSVLPKAKGVHCRDRYLGKVRVAPNGLWEFEEFATNWESSTFGRPSPSLMPGYTNITWADGMFVRTVGSPYGEVQGWRYNRDGNWQMVGGYLINNMVGMVDSTTPPTKFTPFTTIRTSVYGDSGWPLPYGLVDMYTGHPNDRSGAQQVFYGANNMIYKRYWSTTTKTWNSFVAVSLN